MKRSGPLRRTTRLETHTPLRKRGKRGRRFRGYERNEGFRLFVRSHGCILAGKHECHGIIEFCHVLGRGAGGRDEANGYPGCSRAHRQQHDIGIESFQRRYGLDLPATAVRLWQEYSNEGRE